MKAVDASVGAPPTGDSGTHAAPARPVLVGLIGAGIQASRTPALHEREGAAQGLTYIYKIIDLDALGLTAQALPDLLAAARRFGAGRASAWEDAARAVHATDGIVNATPIGMAKYPGMPVARELLRPDLWVADIVYLPLQTELLRTARGLGCRTLSGGGMAVFQAVGAFRLFTRVEPDAERMIRHFERM